MTARENSQPRIIRKSLIQLIVGSIIAVLLYLLAFGIATVFDLSARVISIILLTLAVGLLVPRRSGPGGFAPPKNQGNGGNLSMARTYELERLNKNFSRQPPAEETDRRSVVIILPLLIAIAVLVASMIT